MSLRIQGDIEWSQFVFGKESDQGTESLSSWSNNNSDYSVSLLQIPMSEKASLMEPGIPRLGKAFP